MKPSIPKGTRDFLPREVSKRKYIFNTIESVFKKYAYQPIETPAMESLSTLTGKYGEEGDRLLFKVLNNGDYLRKADKSAIEASNSAKLTSSISKRGLRYDLTIPFARFVVMYQNDISFPFKRYQIQPVWRADRPQKGRYQEFYQCDVDVVGSDSLMYEAELMQIYDEVFAALKLPVRIKLNNRKVLYGIAETAGIQDQFIDMTVAIDKLDKIGEEGVRKDMIHRGISDTTCDQVFQLLSIKDVDTLKTVINSEVGQRGCEELLEVLGFLKETDIKNELLFDISLARGLNYYTGCIFEVEAIGAQIGSIGGGGRYDNLTEVFGLKGVSGVGMSFGAARIYDVMEEMNLFPESIEQSLQVLLVAFDEATHKYAFNVLTKLRAANICADLYPSPVKLKKQMKYANDMKVPFAVLIGEEEMSQDTLTVKDMVKGEQEKMDFDTLIQHLKS